MLIKLTSVPHPDLQSGEPSPVYVDASRILMIESGTIAHTKENSLEAYRQAQWSLHEEVLRADAQLDAMHRTVIPESVKEAKMMDEWMQRKDICNSLQTAYSLVSHYAKEALRYPSQKCTVVSIACGTALEQGVMLARLFVTEPPEEVAAAVTQASISLNPRAYQ